MSPEEKNDLIEECKALQQTVRELGIQTGSFGQQLAVMSEKCQEMPRHNRFDAKDWAAITETIIPAIRQTIREELKSLGPLDEAWYTPAEVSAISCGKVTAETVRTWLRWGQIAGESDGDQVRLPQTTVEALRRNKWRALRQPDPSKLPPSKRKKK